MFLAGSEIGCEACTDAVDFLKTVLNSSTLKGSLVDLIKSECAKLPAPYNADVRSYYYGVV